MYSRIRALQISPTYFILRPRSLLLYLEFGLVLSHLILRVPGPFRALAVLSLHLHQLNPLVPQILRLPVKDSYWLLNLVQVIIHLNIL